MALEPGQAYACAGCDFTSMDQVEFRNHCVFYRHRSRGVVNLATGEFVRGPARAAKSSARAASGLAVLPGGVLTPTKPKEELGHAGEILPRVTAQFTGVHITFDWQVLVVYRLIVAALKAQGKECSDDLGTLLSKVFFLWVREHFEELGMYAYYLPVMAMPKDVADAVAVVSGEKSSGESAQPDAVMGELLHAIRGLDQRMDLMEKAILKNQKKGGNHGGNGDRELGAF